MRLVSDNFGTSSSEDQFNEKTERSVRRVQQITALLVYNVRVVEEY